MANTTVVVPSIAQDSSGNVTSTGQFFGANGTAAAPSFSFTNATGTGMYRPSANALAFSTNGTLALTISTAQLATFAGAVIVNGGQGVYIKGGNGTASPIADTNTPLQIDSGSAGSLKVSYFGANKNGGYGVLFGYSNDSGATGGVGGQFRMVTADPFSIVVNNSTLAAQWDSTGVLTQNFDVKLSAAAPAVNATAATTYLLGIKNNGTLAANVDKGGFLVPNIANPSTYYFSYDWDCASGTTNFTQNGNVVINAVNSVSAPLMAASNMGVAYANTSSTTAGGYVSIPSGYPIIASASINYQWRILFYHPVASTAGNTYTSHIGGCAFTGTANNTLAGGFAGPSITYSHGLNSGNWVLASSVGGTRTTGNSAISATAALGAWNNLLITLANGTYTYTLNGTLLGTLADANITSSVAASQACTAGGIAIVPDGTNFTTQRTLMIDRSDFWVTGLTR